MRLSPEEKQAMADRFEVEQALVDKIGGIPSRKARRDMERFVKTRERKQRRRNR